MHVLPWCISQHTGSSIWCPQLQWRSQFDGCHSFSETSAAMSVLEVWNIILVTKCFIACNGCCKVWYIISIIPYTKQEDHISGLPSQKTAYSNKLLWPFTILVRFSYLLLDYHIIFEASQGRWEWNITIWRLVYRITEQYRTNCLPKPGTQLLAFHSVM